MSFFSNPLIPQITVRELADRMQQAGYGIASPQLSNQSSNQLPSQVTDQSPDQSPDQLPDRLPDQLPDQSLQLIDVREPDEVETASIAGFVNLPLSQFADWADQIQSRFDPEAETLVLCHHGVRSAQMCQWLQAQGFTQVKNIVGGIDAYALEVDASIPLY